LFDAIVADTTSAEELERISAELEKAGRSFFDGPMQQHNLDAIASINNYHAAHAAVAKYPALAVPAGLENTGEPKSITFIVKPFDEDKVLEIGYAFEQPTHIRRVPHKYK